MEKLLTDMFLRRVAQTLIALAILIVALSSILFLVAFLSQKLGWLDEGERVAADYLLRTLSVPLEKTSGQLATAVAIILPVMFSAVCFRVDTATIPWSASTDLNRTGRVLLVVLLAGAAAAVISLIAIDSASGIIGGIVRDPKTTLPDSLKLAFTSMISFQLLCLLQLFGLQSLWKGS